MADAAPLARSAQIVLGSAVGGYVGAKKEDLSLQASNG